MTLRLKDDTVSLVALCPQIVMGLFVLDQILEDMGIPDTDGYHTTVTSANDGKHSVTSFHYDGKAVDIRSRHLTDAQQRNVVAEFKRRMGVNFDFIAESNHFHMEWQPRRPQVTT